VREKGPIEKAVSAIGKLPGFGEKSAARLIYWLLGQGKENLPKLITSLQELAQIKNCSLCGNLSVSDPCPICADQNRNQKVLMVVADAKDLQAIEKTGSYIGRYFVLGGLLSPRLGITPEQLKLSQLFTRLQKEQIEELIIALSSSQEGEATAQWLSQQLSHLKIKITRLARGLPVAASIEYLDPESLKLAIQGRKEF